jgi:hypothetical protein
MSFGRKWMSGRWSFLVRRVMIGLKKSSRLTGRICALRGVASADERRLWMGLLLLLRVVGVEERGAYFGETGRNCWRSWCGLGLVSLRRRSRVRGKSCSWGHVYGQSDAGEAWGVERVEAAEVAVA